MEGLKSDIKKKNTHKDISKEKGFQQRHQKPLYNKSMGYSIHLMATDLRSRFKNLYQSFKSKHIKENALIEVFKGNINQYNCLTGL